MTRRITILTTVVLMMGLACGHTPTPVLQPDRTAEYTHTCHSIWQEELHRDLTDTELVNCLAQARAGRTGDQIRAYVQGLVEWAIVHNPPPIVPPPLVSSAGEIGRLSLDSGHLQTGVGPWRGAGLSAFRMYERYLDGEDLTPQLDEAVTLGANYLRVFGLYQGGIGVLNPDRYPQYYDQLPAFFDLLALHGLRCEFVVFADAQNAMPAVAAQRIHLARVSPILDAAWNVWGELVNEYPKNGINPANFQHPAGTALWSRGSALGESSPPFLPPWDMLTNHGSRGAEWPRKVDCRYFRDTYHIACLEDEPIGAAEVAVPGRRANDPEDFAQYGAVCALFADGCLFHSDDGINAATMRPKTYEAATAFFASLRWVPVGTPHWPYQRGANCGNCEGVGDMPLEQVDLPNPSGTLRTYCKGTATDEWCVAVRPGPRWVARTRGGWHIESEPRRGLVHLVRP